MQGSSGDGTTYHACTGPVFDGHRHMALRKQHTRGFRPLKLRPLGASTSHSGMSCQPPGLSAASKSLAGYVCSRQSHLAYRGHCAGRFLWQPKLFGASRTLFWRASVPGRFGASQTCPGIRFWLPGPFGTSKALRRQTRLHARATSSALEKYGTRTLMSSSLSVNPKVCRRPL